MVIPVCSSRMLSTRSLTHITHILIVKTGTALATSNDPLPVHLSVSGSAHGGGAGASRHVLVLACLYLLEYSGLITVRTRTPPSRLGRPSCRTPDW